jgi:hypothetical protein
VRVAVSGARLATYEEHDEVVTGASGQHKEMPYRVEVRQAVEKAKKTMPTAR